MKNVENFEALQAAINEISKIVNVNTPEAIYKKCKRIAGELESITECSVYSERLTPEAIQANIDVKHEMDIQSERIDERVIYNAGSIIKSHRSDEDNGSDYRIYINDWSINNAEMRIIDRAMDAVTVIRSITDESSFWYRIAKTPAFGLANELMHRVTSMFSVDDIDEIDRACVEYRFGAINNYFTEYNDGSLWELESIANTFSYKFDKYIDRNDVMIVSDNAIEKLNDEVELPEDTETVDADIDDTNENSINNNIFSMYTPKSKDINDNTEPVLDEEDIIESCDEDFVENNTEETPEDNPESNDEAVKVYENWELNAIDRLKIYIDIAKSIYNDGSGTMEDLHVIMDMSRFVNDDEPNMDLIETAYSSSFTTAYNNFVNNSDGAYDALTLTWSEFIDE